MWGRFLFMYALVWGLCRNHTKIVSNTEPLINPTQGKLLLIKLYEMQMAAMLNFARPLGISGLVIVYIL